MARHGKANEKRKMRNEENQVVFLIHTNTHDVKKGFNTEYYRKSHYCRRVLKIQMKGLVLKFEMKKSRGKIARR